eukprot:3730256-Prymnesium_polylepis.1
MAIKWRADRLREQHEDHADGGPREEEARVVADVLVEARGHTHQHEALRRGRTGRALSRVASLVWPSLVWPFLVRLAEAGGREGLPAGGVGCHLAEAGGREG